MKQRISPYSFTNYRDFLRAALKAKGFSYRSFAAKHGDIVSFITLAQTLSRGRSGTKNKPMRNLSPETLARLGKVLKLNEDEITFLALLKHENDSDVLPGIYGNTYLDCMRALIREQKSRALQSVNKSNVKIAKLSETAVTIADFIDHLPIQARQRLTRDILVEGKGFLSRQKQKAGVKVMASVLYRLEELLLGGAP